MKNKTTALLLSIFLGGLGIDRFYLGYTGMGVLKLLTGGCFGILYIIDIVMIITGGLKPANGMDYEDSTSAVPAAQNVSVAEELAKYAELYKQGVISEEEYNRKKADLLQEV